jgi:4-hydroxybenzoyl-CoA thioesterase
MEHFFGALAGGYARLILERRVGLPAVHVEISFSSPARYGDVLRVETRVARVGNRSAVLWYRMLHAATGALCCEMKHTVVTTDLAALASCEMPADVRAHLLAHLEAPS